MTQLLFSGRYRVGRQVHTDIYVAEPTQEGLSAGLVRLIPWDTNLDQVWELVKSANLCERENRGLWIMISPADQGFGSMPHNSDAWQLTEDESVREGFLKGESRAESPRLVTPHERDRDRDFMRGFRTFTSSHAVPQEVSGSSGLTQFVKAHRKLIAFGLGIVVVASGIMFAVTGGSASQTQALAPQGLESSAGPTPESLRSSSLTSPGTTTDAPISASKYVRNILSGVSVDPAADQLLEAMRSDNQSQFLVRQASRNGDVVLCDVASFAPDGTLVRRTVVLVTVGDSWSIRSVAE